MPPIRRTPGTQPRFFQESDDDQGFNPAWAIAPDVLQYTKPPQQSSFSTPRPSTSIGDQITPVRSTITPHPSTSGPTTAAVEPSTASGVDSETGLDLLTYAAMAPFAAAWYIASSANYVVQTGVEKTVALAGAFRAAPKIARFDPLKRTNRSKKETKDSRKSMLDLPPHIVGATPNVVRQARGENRRGQPGPRTPTVTEARDWKLFHATPLQKQPKVVVYNTPLTQSRPTNGPNTPYVTPKFEFSTPQRKIKLGKVKEFAHNVHKNDFSSWLKFLHKHGLRTTTMRTELTKRLQFPTDAILKMAKRSADITLLAKCFCHQGFLTHYRMHLPPIVNPEPTIFRKNQANISLDSVTQQRDGCCRFCRGFAWAGQHEVRTLSENGTIPQRSLHKSVKPYTIQERENFDQHKYDMLFRRWCQESRYDWLFEEPHLKTNASGTYIWKIPDDDPRLRHIAMMKQQHENAVTAKKMYNEDLTQERNALMEQLRKQDLASKILLDAIHRENPEMAKQYRALDLERKRRQVHTEWLCVKQVKLVAAAHAGLVQEPHKRRASDQIPDDLPMKKQRTVAKSVKWASNLELDAPQVTPTGMRKRPAKSILKPVGTQVNVMPVPFAGNGRPAGANSGKQLADECPIASARPSNDFAVAQESNIPSAHALPSKDLSFLPIFPGFEPSRIRKYELSGHRDRAWDDEPSESDRFYFEADPRRNCTGTDGSKLSFHPLSTLDNPSSSSSLPANNVELSTNTITYSDLSSAQGRLWCVEDTDAIKEWISTVQRLYKDSPRQLTHALEYAAKILSTHELQAQDPSLRQIRDNLLPVIEKAASFLESSALHL